MPKAARIIHHQRESGLEQAGPAAMSDELRERVARAIGESLRTARMSLESEGYLPEADAAIALIWNEAMEEAARACDDADRKMAASTDYEGIENGYRTACFGLAAAIRARKKP